jgi:hypothetical protein
MERCFRGRGSKVRGTAAGGVVLVGVVLAWVGFAGRGDTGSVVSAASGAGAARLERESVVAAVTYGTYLGGGLDDVVRGVAVDGEGNVYVVGDTLSGDFPTVNAYQPSNAGSFDIFVSKFDASGSGLIYSTYLGGSGQDHARSIAVGADGSVYVVGSTNSRDFPLANAVQGAYGGGDADAVVFKLGPGGDTLVFSTYLGGSVEDRGYGVAAGVDGSAYVTGATWSDNFPLQMPMLMYCGISTYADGFVAKIGPGGGSLGYSTYLCGDDDDRGIAIAVDGEGNAYVTGHTNSEDFPTLNAYQAEYRGYQDAFVAKVNAAGSALVYSTYFGGTVDEAGWGIALDEGRNVYITGFTKSPDFPLLNAVQPEPGGDDDAFVAKLGASGANLVFSTYLGGIGHDFGQGVAVGGAGGAAVVGRTASHNFPVVEPAQGELRGQSDAFAARFSPAGSALVYSTYLGGSNLEDGWAAAECGVGSGECGIGGIYLAGGTWSGDFPVVEPYQGVNRGGGDGFVGRVSDVSLPSPTPSPTACAVQFSDVPAGHTFYRYVRCLVCRGVVSGYSDGTFRPDRVVTRGQIAKIVANAAGLSEPPGAQTYEDVPPSHTFYTEIMRLSSRSVMSGYACGGPGEPCVPPQNRPYFRPGNNATRGQLSKIVSNAANITDPVSGQFYADVPTAHTFYVEIMRLTGRGVMSGYACGGVGEPCDGEQRPYFRPANNVTRGQVSKIVANAFFPGCEGD